MAGRRSAHVVVHPDIRRSCPEVEVRQVRYLLRGWNGADRSPVHDVRRILDDLRPAQTPVVLVGHSMGARVAAVVADDPLVCGVLALAPWWPEGEGGCVPTGRRMVVVHGTRTPGPHQRRRGDRPRWLRRGAWTPDGSVWRAQGHTMLRHPGRWHRIAVDFVRDQTRPCTPSNVS
ncbi:alpha/beta fold hydrolase [Rhodococcus hoagii]|nr:alpha/beta fold hydrolase [Prescottella equi]